MAKKKKTNYNKSILKELLGLQKPNNRKPETIEKKNSRFKPSEPVNCYLTNL